MENTEREDMDVHTEHCCFEHGCKYGYEDCTVESGEKKQSHDCEDCYYDKRSSAGVFRRLIGEAMKGADLKVHNVLVKLMTDHAAEMRKIEEEEYYG